jgi:DNA-binding YbaB/EbfC family protein
MDFNDIMRMIKDPQAIQAQAEQLRAKTAAIEATGSAGGGMVKVTLSGSFELKSCVIAPEIVDPADLGMLQDLIRAAHNDAAAKVKEAMNRELSMGFGGMGLPPGFPGGLV